MKKWIKILIIVIVAIVALLDAFYIYLFFDGKGLITRSLSRLTHKKVTVADFGTTLPLNLHIRSLVIEDTAKIDSLYISPSVLGFLSGRIAFNNIRLVNPEFTYRRPPENEATHVQLSPSELIASGPRLGNKPLRFFVKRLKIVNGRLDYIDPSAGKEGIKITVKDIHFTLRNLYAFPSSLISSFSLNANIPWNAGTKQGTILAEGWMNFAKKDMKATFKINDIDGIALYPYYSNWVNLEEARIQSAKLNFTSDLISLNNDMTVSYSLELTDIVRRPLSEGESADKASRITDMVLDVFKALDTGNIVLRHSFKTKMDKPQFGMGNIKLAFEDKIAEAREHAFKPQDLLLLPAKVWEQGVKGVGMVSKATVDTAYNAGSGIFKVFEGPPKKEPVKQ